MFLSTSLQTILLLATVLFAYIWLSNPFLSHYSLQIFAFSTIIYFLLKRYSKAKIWHIAPSQMSLEILFASFSFLMLIGASGNRESIFYPLVYVHLFFLVFATRPVTSITVTGALMWFHYALSATVSTADMSDLLTLPLIMGFFIFAKSQYQEVIKKAYLLKKESQMIKRENLQVANFIDKFLQPKLDELKQNLIHTDRFAAQDVEHINIEVQKLEDFVASYTKQFNDQKQDEPS